jgi:hypothetical protein
MLAEGFVGIGDPGPADLAPLGTRDKLDCRSLGAAPLHLFVRRRRTRGAADQPRCVLVVLVDRRLADIEAGFLTRA